MAKKKKKSRFSSKRRSGQSNKKKIYVTDWLKYKPYDRHTAYDAFYTRIANEVFKQIERFKDHSSDDVSSLDVDTRKKIAINLTQYFEDYINEIGTWKAFQKVNKELYGYVLPFYDLEKYEEDDINPEDVRFLLWYYLSISLKTTYVPYTVSIQIASIIIFDIFDKNVENAPLTNFYKDYYKIEATDSYFDVKTHIGELTASNYLLNIEAQNYMLEQIDKLSKREDLPLEALGYMTYLVQEEMMFNHQFSLNGFSGLEWFANIADCSEETKQQILDVKKRVSQEFVFNGRNGDFFIFEHWHTGRVFEIWNDSFQHQKTPLNEGDLIMMNIVPWDGKWWLSGILASMGIAAETKKPPMQERSYSFYAEKEENQEKLKQTTDEMYQAFIKEFGGIIHLVDTPNEYKKAFMKYQRRQMEIGAASDRIKLSKKEIEENLDSIRTMIEPMSRKIKLGSAMAFVKDVGMLFIDDLGTIVKMLKDDFLEPEDTEEIYRFLFYDCPYEVVEHIMDNYPTHNIKFPVDGYDFDVVKYWKFLHRYNSPEAYKPKLPTLKSAND